MYAKKQKTEKDSKLELKLRILAKWLKDSDSKVDSYHDGAMERAVKLGVQEVKQDIGDLIEEILDMDEESLKREEEAI